MSSRSVDDDEHDHTVQTLAGQRLVSRGTKDAECHGFIRLGLVR